MKNLRVSYKLIISFMVVLVFAVAVGALGIYGMYTINAADDALYNENVVAISSIGQMNDAFQELRVRLLRYIMYSENAAKIQEIQNDYNMWAKKLQEYVVIYEGTIIDEPAEADYRNAINIYNKEFGRLEEGVRKASLISEHEAYELLNSESSQNMIQTIVVGFEAGMQNNMKWAGETVDSNTALFMSLLTIELILLVAAIICAIFMAMYISGLIAKPMSFIAALMSSLASTGNFNMDDESERGINDYRKRKDESGMISGSYADVIKLMQAKLETLEAVSGGDLTAEVVIRSPNDSYGNAMKTMVDRLNVMFANIQASTGQVASGAKQVADGAQSLAQGATEQAASIQQLSSSIAEIAGSTKANAEIADKTARLSLSIKGNAEKGSQQMNDMIAAVKEINDASQSISKIIKTIDDIAFQTNILALNAAVEAARAGQHGKGFAVVAEEVRNLASKSAEAAKDTGNMIQNSMEKAALGSRIAGETATSLHEIVTGINESAHMVDDIAKASEAQSMGISQINTGIDQVAQVVQQNSATAEESAAASEEMSSQSTMLEDLISQFKLKDGNSQPARGLPPEGRSIHKAHHSASGRPVFRSGGGDFGKY